MVCGVVWCGVVRCAVRCAVVWCGVVPCAVRVSLLSQLLEIAIAVNEEDGHCPEHVGVDKVDAQERRNATPHEPLLSEECAQSIHKCIQSKGHQHRHKVAPRRNKVLHVCAKGSVPLSARLYSAAGVSIGCKVFDACGR